MHIDSTTGIASTNLSAALIVLLGRSPLTLSGFLEQTLLLLHMDLLAWTSIALKGLLLWILALALMGLTERTSLPQMGLLG